MTDTGTLNLRWADALIDGLAAAGIRRAVISPGSRSTPLVVACDRHPEIKTRVLLDERSAAFYALGAARNNLEPVVLIATSGSASAHWLPAVIEASHSNIPLILISADRPPELQDWGANQTTDQSGFFNNHVRARYAPGTPENNPDSTAFIRALGIKAAGKSQWPHPGPVHINAPFREPLIPPPPLPAIKQGKKSPFTPPDRIVSEQQVARIKNLIEGRPGVIVCGPGNFTNGFNTSVTTLAKVTGTPILADPLSNLRYGKHDRSQVITRYDAFLRSSEINCQLTPEWVLKFGAPPVSSQLTKFLKHLECPLILCAPYGDWPDPSYRTREIVQADAEALCRALTTASPEVTHDSWLSRFQQWEQTAVAGTDGKQPDLPIEKTLIQTLIAELPEGSTLFSGNSMPIRQLDNWSGSGEKTLRITANRGVSGIDGNVSTILGLAEATEGKTVGLLGDLACIHDLNSLLAAEANNALIIVLNNKGGGIFEYLPQTSLENFEKYWLTPVNLDFERVAALYNLHFWRVTQQTNMREALKEALNTPGMKLMEITIDREISTKSHQSYWSKTSKISY